MLSPTSFWRSVRRHLNFYRVHLLIFTFTPLIFSCIFYACNGKYHISYIDSLTNCVSAMTVCGLATVDLSSLTAWQQVILFIQMCMGSPVVGSWIMVLLRRNFFDTKFDHIVEAAAARKQRTNPNALIDKPLPWHRRILGQHRKRRHLSLEKTTDSDSSTSDHKAGAKRVRPEMIRRMDDAPKLVDPSGWISEGRAVPHARRFSVAQTADGSPANRQLQFASQNAGDSPERRPRSLSITIDPTPSPRLRRRLSDPGTPSKQNSFKATGLPMQRFKTVGIISQPPSRTLPPAISPTRMRTMPRTQTVEFAPHMPQRRRMNAHERIGSDLDEIASVQRTFTNEPGPYRTPLQSVPTYVSGTHTFRPPPLTKHSGFGGFPMPHEIAGRVFQAFFPKLKRRLTRTVTVPMTTTIASQHGTQSVPGARSVPYISFDTIVGRNSTFPFLTGSQIEELGGVEYRALNALLWLVPIYHIGIQLTAFIVIAPYMSMSRWKPEFGPPELHRPVASSWYSLFQVVSSYTNTGMSLVDTSMVPFRTAYPMIVIMIYLILAGNTAFPIFLRLFIWILSKLVPEDSRSHETLHFLLDHPRRCFIYLFPSHQTWFLLTMVTFLTATDWFFYMVLDIGTPAIEAIPVGIRLLSGLFQATAVRAAGFGAVSLSALAPAVKVLYVLMMYISVYPVAMSVRATNVYEEQSLGVYNPDDEQDGESSFDPNGGSRITIWSRYLTMHARKQLSFDMWWIGLALFLICIIERTHLDDPETQSTFNIFSIIFELVSAYGTVGLSLGLSDANYSLCGRFRTLSKVILCLVMIRGRHRGLPVAVDRAIMFPHEYRRPGDEDEDDDIVDESVVGDDMGSLRSRKSTSVEGRRRSVATLNANLSRGGGGGILYDRTMSMRRHSRSMSKDVQYV